LTALLNLRDLDLHEQCVVHEVVRFGVMADYQLIRRYADPAVAYERLEFLRAGGLLVHRSSILEGARVFGATDRARRSTRLGLRRYRRKDDHVAHDVALVDLAEHLLGRFPGAVYRTEYEVGPALDGIRPPPRTAFGEPRHQPDGLLLTGAEVIGIELEHSVKSDERYRNACRWFACENRIDRVWWFVDHPRVIERLRQIQHELGYDRDIPVDLEPFPAGVRVRRRTDRGRP
jgi:hypothetical protein